MKPTPSCPACTSCYTLFVQDVLGRRTKKLYPQYFCMDCRSFFHRTGYKENELQKKFDFDFLMSQRENHTSIATQLCLELKTRIPATKSCLEIGFGLGWFLKACRDFGVADVFGFDVSPYCHKHASEVLKLPCANGIFDASHTRTYDLIVAIMVFEHLEKPRELFELMTKRLNRDGSIYLSVPFMERHQWPYLRTAGRSPADAPPDVFYDNDVHINHFSIDGLMAMGRSMGARHADYFVSQDTYFKSPGSYPGILFRF